MNEEKLITGYHGTKRENIDSICKNNFSISLDKENKLFLGYGVYFFYSCEDALDWNIKKFIEEFKYLPEYKIVINKSINYGKTSRFGSARIYTRESDQLPCCPQHQTTPSGSWFQTAFFRRSLAYRTRG